MPRARRQSKPGFFWQAILILLPVGALTSLGWISLHQDKILTQHDATERAQSIADVLVPKLWNEFTNAPGEAEYSFRVNRANELVFPPPFDAVPVPELFAMEKLNSGQVQLWDLIRNFTDPAGNADSFSNACEAFLVSNPPVEFAAATHYQFGLWLMASGKAQTAVSQFEIVLENYPGNHGESGLPLAPLSELKVLQLTARPAQSGPPVSAALVLKHPVSIESFCSNVIFQPTLLTPILLEQIKTLTRNDGGGNLQLTSNGKPDWERVWQQHEISRQLFQAAFPQLNREALLSRPLRIGASPSTTPLGNAQSFNARIFWFSTSEALPDGMVNGMPVNDLNWIAVGVGENGTNETFACAGETSLGFRLNRLAVKAGQIPEYFGIRIELDGKPLLAFAPDLTIWETAHYSYKGGGDWKKEFQKEKATTILATATHAEAGIEILKVRVYLTSPSALYARQRSRVFWFGLLIATAAVTALIGLLAAYRAFRRQLRLNEMKSNFVSSVSHELRAPIASVRLMAESLDRGTISTPQKQNEYFRFIVQECRRLSSLIENVLDFSRIEQGCKQYEFESTDLLALTRETMKLMEPYAAEKSVKLELEILNAQHSTPNAEATGSNSETQTIELNVDGRAIQQALVNLIDNAVKHSAPGQTVTVGLSRGTGSLPIRLWVEDHGPGIPEREQEKIFERFHRLGSELRRETQGVGIGLNIVKHIVEAHGGRVIVKSKSGHGSRFTIELP